MPEPIPFSRRLPVSRPAVFLAAILMTGVPADPARAQANWVGDVEISGDPINLWHACNPCDNPKLPPNTNWSTDRIPGDDGPLGDPGAAAVIGPMHSVDFNGGTLQLGSLAVQGALTISGAMQVAGSAQINNANIESSGILDGGAPFTLTGNGTWDGFLRSSGGFTNQGSLTATSGDLQADLINNGTLSMLTSLNFTSTPATLTNNSLLQLNTDASPTGNSDILNNSGAANLLVNNATISKLGADLSVIEAPGLHAGGTIGAQDGTLRFFRGDWQFSGGDMLVANNGQIELTGNVDHIFDGTSGISGQGSLLVNMSTFGTLTVTEPFEVNLNGTTNYGLILQGIGIDLESTLTSRRGGQWSRGTIGGIFAGQFVNEAPPGEPFRIIPGGTKKMSSIRLMNAGYLLQSSSVVNNGVLINQPGGTLAISQAPVSVNWTGLGGIFNEGTVRVFSGAQSRISAGFSQDDGGELITAGELTLSGGGTWEGTTLAYLTSEHPEPALTLAGPGFSFINGVHRFLDNDENNQKLIIQSGDHHAVTNSTTVLFDIDGSSSAVNMDGGAIGGQGRFENQGVFVWHGGRFGIQSQDSIHDVHFTNTLPGVLYITDPSNVLQGTIVNEGNGIGGLTLFGDAVVSNMYIWQLYAGESIDVTGPVQPSRFDNPGVLEIRVASSGSEAVIATTLNNTGTVRLKPGATLRLTGPVSQVSDGVLDGGTWLLGAESTLILPETVEALGPGTTLRGAERVSGIGSLAELLGADVTITGDLPVNGTLELADEARLIIDGDSTLTAPGGVSNGDAADDLSLIEMLDEQIVITAVPEPPQETPSTLPGEPGPAGVTPAIITPLFENWAILAPGGLGLPGPLNIDGNLVMHPGSTLSLDLAGPVPVLDHDLVAVTGGIDLAGTLEVTVADGFFPAEGQEFTAANAGTDLTGFIDDIVNVNRPDITWETVQAGNDLRLRVGGVESIFVDGFEG